VSATSIVLSSEEDLHMIDLSELRQRQELPVGLPAALRPLVSAFQALEPKALPEDDRSALFYIITAAARRFQHYPIRGERCWDAKRCPRVVAGAQCLASMKHASPPYSNRCICYEFRGILDHPRLWKLPDGGYALTTEPYTLDGRELGRFLTACSELGLRVEIRGASPYFPGETVLLLIERDTSATHAPTHGPCSGG